MTTANRRRRYQKRLDILYKRLEWVEQAIDDFINGRPIKYQTGSDIVVRHDWTYDELAAMEDDLEEEIAKLEDLVDDGTTHKMRAAIFRDTW